MYDNINGVKFNIKGTNKISEKLESLEILMTLVGFKINKRVVEDSARSTIFKRYKIINVEFTGDNSICSLNFTILNNKLIQINTRVGIRDYIYFKTDHKNYYEFTRAKDFGKALEVIESVVLSGRIK